MGLTSCKPGKIGIQGSSLNTWGLTNCVVFVVAVVVLVVVVVVVEIVELVLLSFSMAAILYKALVTELSFNVVALVESVVDLGFGVVLSVFFSVMSASVLLILNEPCTTGDPSSLLSVSSLAVFFLTGTFVVKGGDFTTTPLFVGLGSFGLVAVLWYDSTSLICLTSTDFGSNRIILKTGFRDIASVMRMSLMVFSIFDTFLGSFFRLKPSL